MINTYRGAAQLFVDGLTLYSQEGTTQHAMPLYTLATVPFIHILEDPYQTSMLLDSKTLKMLKV